MLSHFACFLSCVLGVFNSLVATPTHGGALGFARVFDYHLHQRTRACSLSVFVPPPRSHFTKLFTRPLFFGPSHCSCISFHGLSRSCCRQGRIQGRAIPPLRPTKVTFLTMIS